MAISQIRGNQIADGGLTDADIAAANKDGSAGTASMRTLGTGAAQACPGNDSRLSDSRTPTAHTTSHKHGGSDEIATGTPAANAIPKAGSGGRLATGWHVQDLDTAARPVFVGLDLVGNVDNVVSFAVVNNNAGGSAQVQCYAANSNDDRVYFGHTSRAFSTGGGPFDGGVGFLVAATRVLLIGTQSAAPIWFGVNGLIYGQFDTSGRFLIDASPSGDQMRIGHGVNFYKFGRSTSTGLLEIAGTQAGYTGVSIVGQAVVTGESSQSSDLHQWRQYDGTVLSTVSENGYFTTRKNSAPADGELTAGEIAQWFDPDNATPKIRWKAKTSNGTVVTFTLNKD